MRLVRPTNVPQAFFFLSNKKRIPGFLDYANSGNYQNFNMCAFWDLSKKTRAKKAWILAVLRHPDLLRRADWWTKRSIVSCSGRSLLYMMQLIESNRILRIGCSWESNRTKLHRMHHRVNHEHNCEYKSHTQDFGWNIQVSWLPNPRENIWPYVVIVVVAFWFLAIQKVCFATNHFLTTHKKSDHNKHIFSGNVFASVEMISTPHRISSHAAEPFQGLYDAHILLFALLIHKDAVDGKKTWTRKL